MSVVQLGDRVAIHYRVDDPDGTVIAHSPAGEPLILQAGGVDVIHGLSMGVLGAEVGEIRQLQVPPEDAFGPGAESVERSIAKDKLPPDVQVGDELRLTLGERQLSLWVLTEQWGTAWRVSTHHPLAGQSMTIKFKVIALLT